MFKSFLTAILMTLPFLGFSQDISKLPLTAAAKPSAKKIIFYLSGDGGMNSFSQKLTAGIQNKNFAVISLDSRKYFWDQKTPEKMVQDLSAAISHYLTAWNIEEFSIVGYSFGADATLMLAPRLPKDLQSKLKSIVLLSPSNATDLVIKLTDMMGFGNKEGKYKVLAESNKITQPIRFVFGKDEDAAIYKSIPERKNISKIQIPGSHKFDNDINSVLSAVSEGF
ncbi:AcvB/VirJ family lysyl-phosphatidylglycerol hydrolase [Pedobacter sp. AW1-32]|uniref:AcvB/VirJ family lysyl-phosphatidylglycerol hydrolase n=1 Tax=Pedobacter sp. AW1-32 TaxID=3383026 RepID=UPI003FEF6BB9